MNIDRDERAHLIAAIVLASILAAPFTAPWFWDKPLGLGWWWAQANWAWAQAQQVTAGEWVAVVLFGSIFIGVVRTIFGRSNFR